jgi:hypothetical protein
VTGPVNRHGQGKPPHQGAEPGNTYRPPDYVIVISELRGQPWSTGMTLDQALETGRTPAREPDADLEAEP